ncbi:hypothetical protein OSB04_016226 [Centaurea solstitialis]|uniref:ZSWIM1/3 RNaseH-like domain-containing protein n=1 Tax=Centaurea solstitialis TaxID=347529 RepID=A0AA38TDS8_9ASTR|nr:hypothetical protein OSB04_016226 [Centaurea solstitialis]
MRNAFKGGVGESGPTVRDYHNFKRQMVNFVGNKDAQMLINTMVSRKKCNPDFFYEFQCNEKELLNIFWADETMRMNYREFGDCISFDATFCTNQHAMVFVLFVAIDNHKRSVVVGAALMHSEKVLGFRGFPRVKLTRGLSWISKPYWFDKSHKPNDQSVKGLCNRNHTGLI